ncbi:unnamed protein product [Lota lota]
MNLRSAARGFLAFLLSVSALQGNGYWGVTYSPSNVCALRGATAVINCTYGYPDNKQYRPTTVTTLWFTKGDNNQPVDLEQDADYTGRVEYNSGEVSCARSRCHGTCTLRIKDLRPSDSAVYKFRFTTNQQDGKYTGKPGVMLSVTDLQVKVSFPTPTYPARTELKCHSLCALTGGPTYIWFKNGQNVGQGVNYMAYIQSGDSYSCAVKGYEHLQSPLVYAPKTPSVTSSGEEEEGSSVTLSCSSDANPAAKYTWFKLITAYSSRYMNQGQQLVLESIGSSDSGKYYCLVQTELRTKSELIYITLKYGPKHTSVYSSPSGEIEEGSSVTLSCSSDANPAAKYTWFKNNQPLFWEPSQPHTLPSVRPEDRGTYHCHAENKYGQLGSKSLFIDVKYAPKTPSVTMSPSGEIEEGSSVTLSCSSDANPAAKYTWFKVITDGSSRDMNQGQQLVFRNILSSDSGQYRCESRNELGTKSELITINVKYGPKHTSVLSSPSGEIKEGSSVTLSCSSDANPAANYSWFKNDQPLLWEPSKPHTLPSVHPEDRGTYHCHAENKYGQLDSKSLLINVQYAPKTPSVTMSPSGEIEEGSSVTLSCSSDANPAAKYTWFKDHGSVKESGQNFTITNITSELEGNYYCQAHNAIGHHNSTFLFIKVTMSPSGEIEEGSSVTLSCSSDANPAAKYTWFKVITDGSSRDMNQGQQLVFRNILSSDSGQYRCESRNELGTKSELITINVKYGPKDTSVLSSPSGEIKEGSSVTLSCSSDANPAANYSWFKNDQPLLWEPSQPHTLPSVHPEDRGTYHCHAENKYGQLDSKSLLINVQYAPKTPSVTMSPSGEIEEGSSVTLSCSSDANPAANYTWFKDHGSVKESGQNVTITNITSELEGNYYCQARNAIGHHNSTFLFIKVTTSSQTAIVAVTTIGVVLATILLLVFLWMRRKRASRKARGQGGRPDTVEEREPIEEQDDCHYASIHTFLSEKQEVPRCLAGSRVQSDQTDAVFYSVINIKRPNAVPGENDQTEVAETAALYSTVKKCPRD